MAKRSKRSYQVPRMDGKTVLITGATRGIGEAATIALASSGARMILVGRSEERVGEVVEQAEQIEGAGEISGEVCDLLDQREIRELAERVKKSATHLDVLVNNAGAIFTKNIKTSDGFERTWALNHNAYFLLTVLLKDELLAAPAARIISTSSGAHGPAKIVWDDIQYERRGNKKGWSSYCQSKLANILFTKELARKLEGTNATANCIHPGFVNTGFSRNNGIIGKLMMTLTRPVQRRPTRGAESIVWLATAEEASSFNGEYVYNCKKEKTAPAARNMEDAARLWSLSEEMTDTRTIW